MAVVSPSLTIAPVRLFSLSLTNTNMNIQDRANSVLKQIDEALALEEKATEGPWEWTDNVRYTGDGGLPCYALTGNDGYGVLCCDGAANSPQMLGEDGRANATFIAASRTLLPTSLRCLKTATEDWLYLAETVPFREMAANRLITLCDQWEAQSK